MEFAKFMLKLLYEGKRIINIDETWIGSCNFQRMHWQSPQIFTSIVNTLVRPRVSVIVAIDTKGNIFASIMHMNSNAASFGVFISYLVE
jgi:ABC-type sugar transport system permease subunit